MNICFLTKKEKPYVDDAISYLDRIAKKIDIYDGSSIKEFPDRIINENYDMIIAYISGWIVPNSILKKTKRWNINFHPGPPEYPGIGCFNFAIYNSSNDYGCTANIMEPRVDTGKIIAVNRFSIGKNEDVYSLSLKTYKYLFQLFKVVVDNIYKENDLPYSDELWSRKPYKRKDLENLCQIKEQMNEEEVNKRIRATFFKGKPAPYIEIFNKKFEYNPDR